MPNPVAIGDADASGSEKHDSLSRGRALRYVRGLLNLALAKCVMERRMMSTIAYRAAFLRGTLRYLVTTEAIRAQIVVGYVLLSLRSSFLLIFLAEHDKVVGLTKRAPAASVLRLSFLLAGVMTPG